MMRKAEILAREINSKANGFGNKKERDYLGE
jgi:hypothetical protein